MILWIILFLLVVGISFLLALRSMRDYQEIPQTKTTEYGLFRIRQIENFDENILNSLREHINAESLILSIERLFKGKQTALVVFGPKKVLGNFADRLNLLELEDYAADLNHEDTSTWEIGMKNSKNISSENLNNIFKNMPELAGEDQFFWQVVLGKHQTQIRAAFFNKDSQRREVLIPLLQDLGAGELVKIPRPFSKEQMMGFYQLRSVANDSGMPVLTSSEITQLIKI
ncbi:hypothetical protein A3I48_04425 [Candidatus Daviesbacteria bacterium RIFCSPLOWO2_02_FULL_36_7]|uniref:Uncharacterized protein n=1 Tax=Candidatus Daviesbacteria bacterium RIFCSPLOWO2_02_FULL_36_7 TaxID=1797792 RepID=A0A1F5MHC5_9BACT|nr:MAG: hypothetical protein A3I48_04425 [Candidatus Daviesbacteria bacterium RIFCSPLOWO2_02_FULL_36_7]